MITAKILKKTPDWVKEEFQYSQLENGIIRIDTPLSITLLMVSLYTLLPIIMMKLH